MSADLSASSGPTTTGVDDLAEVLRLHDPLLLRNRVDCRCGWTFNAPDEHRRHLAEVIAASGVVVPVAEVRDAVEHLADEFAQRAVVAGKGSADRRRALHRAADDLRGLLARLAGEGR